MSLSKQFGFGFIFILIIVFISSLWINVDSTRKYIDDQLLSHAQDTATSLGLSISPYLGDESDIPIVDTMVNAIFDRGYYESIVLTNTKEKILLEKENPPLPEMVPSWFVSLFPLTPPEAETEVNNGWMIAGTLKVKSHPGLGYAQLWTNAKKIFVFTSLLFVVGAVLLFMLLKLITTPIKAVVLASEKISARDFSEIHPVPKTKELRFMVNAINKMANILNKQHKELTAQAESYYQTAYIDALTQLGNKLALDNKLARTFAEDEINTSGYLILVRLSSLNHVNESEGAQTADIYIKTVSHILYRYDYPGESEVFRVRGGDFAILLGSVNEQQCIKAMQDLSEELQEQELPIYVQGCAHMGAAHYTKATGKVSLFEKADAALTTARNSPERWQIASAIAIHQSQHAWREEFSRILEQRAVEVVIQGVFDFDKKVVYSECFARFRAENGTDYLPMSQLVPESERLRVAAKLDLLIIEKVVALHKEKTSHVAINLSANTVADEEMLEQIFKLVASEPGFAEYMTIELHEKCLIRAPQNCQWIADKVRELGGKLTIERVGTSIAAFTHLRTLRPDFIKIDGSFTRDIQNSEDNQFFVRSLVNIAHGLNILVIAELVETQEEADTLQSLFVDYTQGYFNSAPVVWSN